MTVKLRAVPRNIQYPNLSRLRAVLLPGTVAEPLRNEQILGLSFPVRQRPHRLGVIRRVIWMRQNQRLGQSLGERWSLIDGAQYRPGHIEFVRISLAALMQPAAVGCLKAVHRVKAVRKLVRVVCDVGESVLKLVVKVCPVSEYDHFNNHVKSQPKESEPLISAHQVDTGLCSKQE